MSDTEQDKLELKEQPSQLQPSMLTIGESYSPMKSPTKSQRDSKQVLLPGKDGKPMTIDFEQMKEIKLKKQQEKEEQEHQKKLKEEQELKLKLEKEKENLIQKPQTPEEEQEIKKEEESEDIIQDYEEPLNNQWPSDKIIQIQMNLKQSKQEFKEISKYQHKALNKVRQIEENEKKKLQQQYKILTRPPFNKTNPENPISKEGLFQKSQFLISPLKEKPISNYPIYNRYYSPQSKQPIYIQQKQKKYENLNRDQETIQLQNEHLNSIKQQLNPEYQKYKDYEQNQAKKIQEIQQKLSYKQKSFQKIYKYEIQHKEEIQNSTQKKQIVKVEENQINQEEFSPRKIIAKNTQKNSNQQPYLKSSTLLEQQKQNYLAKKLLEQKKQSEYKQQNQTEKINEFTNVQQLSNVNNNKQKIFEKQIKQIPWKPGKAVFQLFETIQQNNSQTNRSLSPKSLQKQRIQAQLMCRPQSPSEKTHKDYHQIQIQQQEQQNLEYSPQRKTKQISNTTNNFRQNNFKSPQNYRTYQNQNQNQKKQQCSSLSNTQKNFIAAGHIDLFQQTQYLPFLPQMEEKKQKTPVEIQQFQNSLKNMWKPGKSVMQEFSQIQNQINKEKLKNQKKDTKSPCHLDNCQDKEYEKFSKFLSDYIQNDTLKGSQYISDIPVL